MIKASCPNCKTTLAKKFAKGHYGARVIVDQCPQCGGIWCDRLEMHKLSHKSVRNIDLINSNILTEVKAINKKLICPKCKINLKDLKDPYFPKQLKLEYCSDCGGFWLNRGELIYFKDWQKTKLDKSKGELSEEDKKLRKQIYGMLSAQSNNTYETLGVIGRILGSSKRQPPEIMDPEIRRDLNKILRFGTDIYLGANLPKTVFFIYTIIQSIYDRLLQNE